MRLTTTLAATLVATLGLGVAGAQQAHAGTGLGTIIAHRGLASADATENGRAAIRDAMRAGANGVEVDVRVTRDGKQIVMHDATVNRTTGCAGTVSRMTYDEVRACKLNSGEKVPNLYEAAWEFSKWANKSDTLWIHVKFSATSQQRSALFKAVDKYGLRKQVVILADEDNELDDWRKWSGIRRALIFNQDDVNQGGSEAWEGGFDYAVPYATPVTEDLIATARAAGSLVYAVDGYPLTAAEAAPLGLDGFVANQMP